MGHIFISYSRRDGNASAERLEKALKEHGFSVWRDIRDIDPANDFTRDIEKGIEAASHVVVCVTVDSKRHDSFVRRELRYAQVIKKPTIPLRFVDIPPHVPIINFEWIDLFREWDKPFERLCLILGSEANDFHQEQTSSDPFQPYLETLYKRTIDFLSRAVFKLIDLTSEEIPYAVDTPTKPAKTHDMIDLFFEAHGIGEEEKAGEHIGSPLQYTNFRQAFDAYDGRILLLGEPGAGKTITLMAFARDAAVKRLSDPNTPLPLLGLISSWNAEKQTPLHEWLSSGNRELDAEKVKQVIADGKALLMLDGLDELGGENKTRLGFVSNVLELTQDKTIKRTTVSTGGTTVTYDPRLRFIQIIPSKNQIIITCRAKNYDEMSEKAKLIGAVTLKPLDDGQVGAYLAEYPELWMAMQQDAELKKMLTTPLLLSLFTFAYQGMTVDEREQLMDLSKSPGDLRDKIFEYYVRERYRHEERKLNRRGEKIRFTLEKIYEILGCAAMGSINDLANNLADAPVGLFIANYLHRCGLPSVDDSKHFISNMVLLHILMPDQPPITYRFTHALLRNHFSFRHTLPLTRHQDWRTRYNAIEILGSLGDDRAIAPLILALEDEVHIRLIAAYRLGYFNNNEAVAALAKSLLDTRRFDDGYGDWISVSQVAVEALERIGTPEALEAVTRWRTEQGKQGE